MAKEIKKVKCKGCRLTYDKKIYECPYCHKKRFNPTGLIILLIIIIAAGGTAYYFYSDEIIGYFSEKETVLEIEEKNGGLVFKNVLIEKYKNNEDIYTVKFDIINKTGESLDKEYTLVNLADKVKAKVIEGNFIYISNDYERVSLHMMPDEIYKAEYNIQIKDEWKELEIYLREYISESKEYNDIKVFTYTNTFGSETMTESETTTINIITEN